MTKKNYIQPELEILPVGTMVALCESGETTDTITTGDHGANSFIEGRAPGKVF